MNFTLYIIDAIFTIDIFISFNCKFFSKITFRGIESYSISEFFIVSFSFNLHAVCVAKFLCQKFKFCKILIKILLILSAINLPFSRILMILYCNFFVSKKLDLIFKQK